MPRVKASGGHRGANLAGGTNSVLWNRGPPAYSDVLGWGEQPPPLHLPDCRKQVDAEALPGAEPLPLDLETSRTSEAFNFLQRIFVRIPGVNSLVLLERNHEVEVVNRNLLSARAACRRFSVRNK